MLNFKSISFAVAFGLHTRPTIGDPLTNAHNAATRNGEIVKRVKEWGLDIIIIRYPVAPTECLDFVSAYICHLTMETFSIFHVNERTPCCQLN